MWETSEDYRDEDQFKYSEKTARYDCFEDARKIEKSSSQGTGG